MHLLCMEESSGEQGWVLPTVRGLHKLWQEEHQEKKLTMSMYIFVCHEHFIVSSFRLWDTAHPHGKGKYLGAETMTQRTEA